MGLILGSSTAGVCFSGPDRRGAQGGQRPPSFRLRLAGEPARSHLYTFESCENRDLRCQKKKPRWFVPFPRTCLLQATGTGEHLGATAWAGVRAPSSRREGVSSGRLCPSVIRATEDAGVSPRRSHCVAVSMCNSTCVATAEGKKAKCGKKHDCRSASFRLCSVGNTTQLSRR